MFPTDPDMTPLFNVPRVGATIDPGMSMPGTVDPHMPGPSPRLSSDDGGFHEQNRKHTGVAGIARDVLGTLGDFLLTRLHMHPMYAPAQENRRLNEAMQNFDSDPLGAIKQVEDVDFATGAKIRDQYIDNQRQAAQQASTAEARASRLQLAREAADQKARSYAGSLINSMWGNNWNEDKRKANWPQVRALAIKNARAQGADLDKELPEAYDPVQIQAFTGQFTPVAVQNAQGITQDRNADLHDEAGARIGETGRHNRATEATGNARLNETATHNRTTEATGNARAAETATHNRTTEGIATGRAAETGRHNRVIEAQPKPGDTKVINGVTWVIGGDGKPHKQ